VFGTPQTTTSSAVVVTATATCPAGKIMLGGGATVSITDSHKERAQLVQSAPTAVATWTAGAVANGSPGTLTVTAYIVCTA
jgi:hypothetical protein